MLTVFEKTFIRTYQLYQLSLPANKLLREALWPVQVGI